VIAEAREFQIRDDLWMKEATEIGDRRDFETGKNLLGNAGSSNHVSSLQDKDLESHTRQIAGSNQPVVSRPDDYSIIASSHRL